MIRTWGLYVYESESESHSVVSNSLRPHGLYSPLNSPGQNTGVGSLSLLQWIILTQESNWSFLHCTQILYQLSFIGLCCCCCCCWVASVVSDSGRPYRWQPTRLPCPWDSPGKKTGVGCTSFSTAWKWKVKVKSLSHVQLFATPWTAAHQAPLSMGFSRQEYWSGVIGLYSILIMNNEFVEKC